MRIALGRIAGTIPRVCLHPGDARRQNTAVPSSSTFLFPWCPLQGARECPDRDFRERHFGLCTSFREAAGRGCRKKKPKNVRWQFSLSKAPLQSLTKHICQLPAVMAHQHFSNPDFSALLNPSTLQPHRGPSPRTISIPPK